MNLLYHNKIPASHRDFALVYPALSRIPYALGTGVNGSCFVFPAGCNTLQERAGFITFRLRETVQFLPSVQEMSEFVQKSEQYIEAVLHNNAHSNRGLTDKCVDKGKRMVVEVAEGVVEAGSLPDKLPKFRLIRKPHYHKPDLAAVEAEVEDNHRDMRPKSHCHYILHHHKRQMAAEEVELLLNSHMQFHSSIGRLDNQW